MKEPTLMNEAQHLKICQLRDAMQRLSGAPLITINTRLRDPGNYTTDYIEWEMPWLNPREIRNLYSTSCMILLHVISAMPVWERTEDRNFVIDLLFRNIIFYVSQNYPGPPDELSKRNNTIEHLNLMRTLCDLCGPLTPMDRFA